MSGFPGGSVLKNPPANAGDVGDWDEPWVAIKILILKMRKLRFTEREPFDQAVISGRDFVAAPQICEKEKQPLVAGS